MTLTKAQASMLWFVNRYRVLPFIVMSAREHRTARALVNKGLLVTKPLQLCYARASEGR